MNIILEIPIKKEIVNCADIGPLVAQYGIDINLLVYDINKLLNNKEIDLYSKINLNIDVGNRTYSFINLTNKTSEIIKRFAKNNKINYSDLETIVKDFFKNDKTKINNLIGTCKSMHIEIIN